MNHYISKGLQADKILVGVTAAGTRFKLQNTNLTGVGAPVVKSPTQRISDLWELPDRFAYPEVRPLRSVSIALRYLLRKWEEKGWNRHEGG